MKKIDWIKPKARPIKSLPKKNIDLVKTGVGIAVGFAALGIGLAAFESLDS